MSGASAALRAWILMFVVGVSGAAWGQVSPFTAVEFEEDGTLMVTLDGERVALVLLGGVPTAELIAGAKREFGDDWQKRIGEDLLEVFEALEVELDSEDVIDVVIFRDGEFVEVMDAPMTRDNRQLVWEHNRVVREREQLGLAGDVLGSLVEIIRDRHAYATLRGVDLDAIVAKERERLGDRPSVDALRLAGQRIVSALGDGHARVDGWDDSFPRGRLPFLLVAAGEGVVAIENDRSALVDPEHPYVESIDGVPLERWIDAASVYVAAGSPQLVRERSLRLIRYVNFVRGELGLVASSDVSLKLRSATGGTAEVERRVTPVRGIYGTWPLTTSRMMEGDIGYFRLPSMSPESRGLPSELWRRQLRDELALVTRGAAGLIIDVRGNGGGLRDPIFAIMPSLMERGSEPVVVNAARARIDGFDNRSDPEGFLGNRYLYPAAWSGWSEAERASIAAFRADFRPEWSTPDDGFSDWHYMVVSPGGDEVVRFEGPVVVLMDDTCFSATDIFVGALGELSSVTLVGTPSAGGSARSRGYEIGPIEVRVASMASYQPNGRLYDGNGVSPDVIVEKRPGDVVLGGGDAQLDRAVELLRESGG
ncbi:MAG: S41 family peptidase [Planctomycetota bacterium]